MKPAENYCKVCGGLIQRKRRPNGQLQPRNNYMAMKTCGPGTKCDSIWRSQFMMGKKNAQRAVPDYEDRTAGHPWLYRPAL